MAKNLSGFTRHEIALTNGFDVQIINIINGEEATEAAARIEFFMRTIGSDVYVTLEGIEDQYDGNDSTIEVRRQQLEF